MVCLWVPTQELLTLPFMSSDLLAVSEDEKFLSDQKTPHLSFHGRNRFGFQCGVLFVLFNFSSNIKYSRCVEYQGPSFAALLKNTGVPSPGMDARAC